LIKVEACGVCHGDCLAVDGSPIPAMAAKYPIVPGHEIVGVIEKVGPDVHAQYKVGDRVGVGWSGGGCEKCPECLKHNHHGCKSSLVTGLKCNGGYAEYHIARQSALLHVPTHVNAAELAPLLCAGNTVYGAIRHANLQPGALVAVQGMGGLGHLAVQYAAKLGYKTVAISRGKDKEPLVRSLGAHEYIDSSAVDAAETLKNMGGAQLIICTASDSKAIEALIHGVAHGGELTFVSLPDKPLNIPGYLLLGMSRRVSGWVGDYHAETIRFSLLTGVKPTIETFPLEKAQEAYDKMKNATVKFRSVIVMTPPTK